MNTKNILAVQLHNNGGITIPFKVRKSMGMRRGDAFDMRIMPSGTITLKLRHRRCPICGSDKQTLTKLMDGLAICPTCSNTIDDMICRGETLSTAMSRLRKQIKAGVK